MGPPNFLSSFRAAAFFLPISTGRNPLVPCAVRCLDLGGHDPKIRKRRGRGSPDCFLPRWALDEFQGPLRRLLRVSFFLPIRLNWPVHLNFPRAVTRISPGHLAWVLSLRRAICFRHSYILLSPNDLINQPMSSSQCGPLLLTVSIRLSRLTASSVLSL